MVFMCQCNNLTDSCFLFQALAGSFRGPATLPLKNFLMQFYSGFFVSGLICCEIYRRQQKSWNWAEMLPRSWSVLFIVVWNKLCLNIQKLILSFLHLWTTQNVTKGCHSSGQHFDEHGFCRKRESANLRRQQQLQLVSNWWTSSPILKCSVLQDLKACLQCYKEHFGTRIICEIYYLLCGTAHPRSLCFSFGKVSGFYL